MTRTETKTNICDACRKEVTEGEIYIGDRLVNDVPPKDRDIAMVFQNYALYPHMDVYNNMAFGLKLRRTPRADIEKRVHNAARILKIEESNKPVHMRSDLQELFQGKIETVGLAPTHTRPGETNSVPKDLQKLIDRIGE